MTRKGGRWRHSSISLHLAQPLVQGPTARAATAVRRTIPSPSRPCRPPPGREFVALSLGSRATAREPELWQRANDQLNAGQTGARRNNPEPELYLLRAGFIRCGYCGGAMCALRVRRACRRTCASNGPATAARAMGRCGRGSSTRSSGTRSRWCSRIRPGSASSSRSRRTTRTLDERIAEQQAACDD